MEYKLQYKDEDKGNIFVDIKYSSTSLDEIKEYLEAIRQPGVTYRIYSTKIEIPKLKTKTEIKKTEIKIKEIKIEKNKKIKKTEIEKIPKSPSRKYLNRIAKGP